MQAYKIKFLICQALAATHIGNRSGVLIIQEFDLNGNLIFDWDASQRLDILDYQTFYIPGIQS